MSGLNLVASFTISFLQTMSTNTMHHASGLQQGKPVVLTASVGQKHHRMWEATVPTVAVRITPSLFCAEAFRSNRGER